MGLLIFVGSSTLAPQNGACGTVVFVRFEGSSCSRPSSLGLQVPPLVFKPLKQDVCEAPET